MDGQGHQQRARDASALPRGELEERSVSVVRGIDADLLLGNSNPKEDPYVNHSTDLEAPPAAPQDSAVPDVPMPARADGRVNADISNAVVRIFRDYLGRGPTKARTSIRDNLVIVLLEDTLTKAEKTLAAEGQTEAVLQMRRTFQRTMRETLSGAVAEFTGRRVVAFMSDNHIDPDYCIEAFVLEPSAQAPGPPPVEPI